VTNIVVLQGRLSRPPGERELPSGDSLAALELSVPAPPGGRADSVPLVWFDPPAWVGRLDTGAELVVLGRVRRRFFRNGAGLASRTEVIVEAAAPLRQPARVAAIVKRALSTLSSPELSAVPTPLRRARNTDRADRRLPGEASTRST